jgi:uncharacterized protein YfaS (alpha-2-macroglobulin family)
MANIFHYKTLKMYPNWDIWYAGKSSGNPVNDVDVSITAYVYMCLALKTSTYVKEQMHHRYGMYVCIRRNSFREIDSKYVGF